MCSLLERQDACFQLESIKPFSKLPFNKKKSSVSSRRMRYKTLQINARDLERAEARGLVLLIEILLNPEEKIIIMVVLLLL